MAQTLAVLSSICGWLYFLAWSVSFYPQPLLNWRRRSTQGLLIDYPLLNVIGYACYSASISALLYSPVIRAQYAARHTSHSTPTARIADLAFAGHAGILSAITLSQFSTRIWGWRSEASLKLEGRSAMRPTPLVSWLIMAGGLFVAVSVTVVLVSEQHGQSGQTRQWLDVITSLSVLKVLVTIAKYLPQAFSHCRKRSTMGFSIVQVLLDIAGGVFSLAQLMIDSYDIETGLKSMFDAMAENPGKLGLAGVSLFFDGIFVVQHFVIYGPVENGMLMTNHNDDTSATDGGTQDPERQPLLQPRHEQASR